MFEWTVIFTILALIAYTLGATTQWMAIIPVAKILFYVFLVMAGMAFIGYLFPKKRRKGLIIDIKYDGKRSI